MRLAIPTIALLCLACTHTQSTAHTASEARAHELTLDHAVQGSTAGWDWQDGPGGDVFRFVAPKTASYRFRTNGGGDHVPSIELYILDEIGVRRSLGATMSMLSVPLNAGVYYLNVDGNRVDRGRYMVEVGIDTMHDSAIRAEDPNVVEPSCAQATVLLDSPALGTFESRSGGARASCGGTGGGAIYLLDVKEPSRVTLDAAAQFKIALELRAECMHQTAPLACTTSQGYEATLSANVGPGRYFVVLDSAEVGSLKTGLPDAAIRGAYSLHARVDRGTK